MNLRGYKECAYFVVISISITGCSTPRYAWKNYDAGKSNDAQLSMDQGECQMTAYQSVPAVVPQQNINQTTNINTYNQGYSSNLNQMMAESQRDRSEAYQRIGQQNALNNARVNIFNGCMSARGWTTVRIDSEAEVNARAPMSSNAAPITSANNNMPASYGQTGRVQAEIIGIYSEPKDGAKRVGVLTKGSMVTITIQKDGWLKVEQSDGTHGWVVSDAIYVVGSH